MFCIFAIYVHFSNSACCYNDSRFCYKIWLDATSSTMNNSTPKALELEFDPLYYETAIWTRHTQFILDLNIAFLSTKILLNTNCRCCREVLTNVLSAND